MALRQMAMAAVLSGLAAMLQPAPALAREEEKLPVDFVAMTPLMVPILDDYRVQGVLSTRFTVQAPDQRLRGRIEADRPKLMDAYVRVLTEFARLWVDPNRPLNTQKMVRALQQETDRLFPRGETRVVLLEATVRRL